MNQNKLSQLFDFQKFEKNEALSFAIRSAQNYVKSLSSTEELSCDEMDELNAAGIPSDKLPQNFREK